jgi:hypothetical protein
MFISYRFSGVPVSQLDQLIHPIYSYFKDSDVDIFCNYYRDKFYVDNSWDVNMIMAECFQNIDKSHTIICLVDTDKYSCGMLLEIGYALAKHKNIIVCSRINCEINTLCKMASLNIVYSDYPELLSLLKEHCNIQMLNSS